MSTITLLREWKNKRQSKARGRPGNHQRASLRRLIRKSEAKFVVFSSNVMLNIGKGYL